MIVDFNDIEQIYQRKLNCLLPAMWRAFQSPPMQKTKDCR